MAAARVSAYFPIIPVGGTASIFDLCAGVSAAYKEDKVAFNRRRASRCFAIIASWRSIRWGKDPE